MAGKFSAGQISDDVRQGGCMRRKIFLGLILSGLLIVPHSLFAQEEDPGKEPGVIEELKLFSKAISVIKEAYVEDTDQRQLLYDAIKGMLSSLDKFSEFIDPEKYRLLEMHMRGEYVGIGVMLEVLDDYPAIKAVKPDSEAEKAGVEPGDKILEVNGEPVKGVGLPEVAGKIRGEEHTTLTLLLRRDRTKKTFEVEIKREKVEIDAVKDARIVGKSIGYLWLQGWQDNTLAQFEKAVEKLKGQGMKALIIDLRDNDGGLMPQALALADLFLPKDKLILSVDSKIEEQRQKYFSEKEEWLKGIPLVILVNQNSASASEIFSAVMQDYKRATLVGRKTYGKASVQSVIPLDEESAMKLTTARYLSPLGRNINHEGIEPDIVIEAQEAPSQTDEVILKALEIFREYM